MFLNPVFFSSGMEKKVVLPVMMLVLLMSCSPSVSLDSPSADNKTAKYGQAILQLHEENSTAANLEKRFLTLQKTIDKIMQGEQDLTLAQFTRIKIELDYLKLNDYDSRQLTALTTNFKKTFAKAEAGAQLEKGLSLSELFSSLDEKLEKYSTTDDELTMVEYLKIEKGLQRLEQYEYPSAKVLELRKKLFQKVLAELESAIVDVEIPEIEEVPEEIEDIPAAEEAEPSPEEPSGPKTHLVKVIDGGFEVSTLKIKVGDTVEWKNVREGRYKIGFIIGNRNCKEIKSKLFSAGESFSWTFTEEGTCYISDGIYTTQFMKVKVVH